MLRVTLPHYGHEIIALHYLPEDLQFPDDPGHMRKADALQLVEFIQAQQVSHPGDVFQFSHWINDDGKFKDPVEDDNSRQSDASEPVMLCPGRDEHRLQRLVGEFLWTCKANQEASCGCSC